MASPLSDLHKPGGANRKVTDFFKRYGSQNDVQKRFTGRAEREKAVTEAEMDPAVIARAGNHEQPASLQQRPRELEQREDHTDISREESGTFTGVENEPPGSTQVRTQRGIKNGRLVIRSSDDEEDSDSSLEEIGSLLGRPKAPSPAPPSASSRKRTSDALENVSPCPAVTRSRTSGVRTLRKDTKQAQAQSSQLPAAPTYKFSLASLVDQTVRDVASEAGVAEARLALQAADEKPSAADRAAAAADAAASGGPTEIDAQLFKSVVDEDDVGGLGRIMNAVHRTEALSRAKAWRFFQQSRAPPNVPARSRKFPAQIGTQTAWCGVLRDSQSRQQAFTSGFVGEMVARIGPLPVEVTTWVLNELPLEPRRDLRFGYVNALKASSSQVGHLLDPTKISNFFKALGGSDEGVDIKQSIRPVPLTSESPPKPTWSNLLTVLDVIAGTSSSLSRESREHAICLLLRLLLDTDVAETIEVQLGIESTLTNLFDTVPEEDLDYYYESLTPTIITFSSEPTFRDALIRHMPSSTPRLQTFRRHLALIFILDDDMTHLKSTHHTSLIQALTTYLLESPRFAISQTTNYTNLASLTSILDIALDNGRSPPSTFTTNPTDTLTPTHPQTPAPPAMSTSEFNKQVDALAQAVKQNFTRIIDTGASHMTRTEAKENLDRLHVRLVYAVRTKAKKKRDLFQSQIRNGDVDVNGVDGQSGKVGKDAVARFFKAVKMG